MKINASQPSSLVEIGLLNCPLLLFSCLSGFPIFGPYFRPHTLRSGSCLNSVSLHLDHIHPFEGSSFNSVNFCESICLFFLQHIQICVSNLGHINVFQWNGECFFFRHIELNCRFIMVTTDEVTLFRPEVGRASASSVDSVG